MSISVSSGAPRLAANSPSAESSSSYTIRRGDTLSAIAKQHGVSLQALLAANPHIANPDVIYPDQRIALPANAGRSGAGGDAAPAPASSATTAAAAPNAATGGMGVTAAQLQQIVPGLSASKAAEVAPHLSRAMAEANINTPTRQAMFIAQLAHESGGFRYSEEIWGPTAAQRGYEGRRDLGNTQPGDGYRFRGRGYIQLTGRYNYERAGQALGLNLTGNPDLAARPENAARVAAWYWNSRNINAAADRGDFVQVTRLINGGTNGLAARQAYYDRARAVLGTGGGDGTPPPENGNGTYTVRSGDTLSGIAARHHTTVAALMHANPSITNPNRISVGQVIKLPGASGGDGGGTTPAPSGGSYTVRSGDTLSGIASRHHTTVAALMHANPSITNANRISVGQVIKLPGASGGDGGGSTPAPSGGNYTVRSGDTLSGIASRHHTTVAALMHANPSITNANRISVGQVIKLPGASNGGGGSTPAPSGGSYTVRSGDTLSGIASRHHTTVAALMHANPSITNANRISVGQVIRLSGTGGTAGTGHVGGAGGQRAANIAAQFLNRNASELKRSGALPMNPHVPSNVCCANFVSAVLQKAGMLNVHTDLVSGSSRTGRGVTGSIGQILKARGWHVVSAAQARPGDVAIVNNGHHVEMVYSNKGGKVTLIGSNNRNADGSQRVSWGTPYGNAWFLSPPR